MLSVPKTPFLIVGVLEALAAAAGMAAAGKHYPLHANVCVIVTVVTFVSQYPYTFHLRDGLCGYENLPSSTKFSSYCFFLFFTQQIFRGRLLQLYLRLETVQVKKNIIMGSVFETSWLKV